MSGSRTPSPIDVAQQSTGTEEKPGDMKGSDSSTSSTSNSPETGESRLVAEVKKEGPMMEDSGALTENGLSGSGVHSLSSDATTRQQMATAATANGLSSKVSPPKAGAAADKKPVAKVEPTLLDPAHHQYNHHGLATRKSGVDGQMELLKKRISPETTPSKQMKSKITAKLARVPADNPSGDPSGASDGKQSTSGTAIDEVGAGLDEGIDDSPLAVPVREEYVCGGCHFRKVFRRMGGRNQCARTDLVYERMSEKRRPDPLAVRDQQSQLSQQRTG